MPESGAIVLAAGVGSRLRPITEDVPKCLVSVAGRAVLGWQLDALLGAGVPEVTVVAGYRAAQVAEFCRAFGGRVRVVVNEEYASTNNMYSLLLAARSRPAGGVLLCNGDVVADPSIVRDLRQAEHPNLIAAQRGAFLDESMKIDVAGGRVMALSKTIAREAAWGVSIDVYRFGEAAFAAILDAARTYIEGRGERTLWTEVAIAAALPALDVRPFDIGSRSWVEVDTHEDLALGERLFAGVQP